MDHRSQKRISVRLSLDDYILAEKMGKGIVTDGIRLAIQECAKLKGITKEEAQKSHMLALIHKTCPQTTE